MSHRINSAEYTRLASLYRYGILDPAPLPAVDGIVRELASHLQVPVAQLVFADAWQFRAKTTVGPAHGVALRGNTVADAIIAKRRPLAVPDADREDRVPGDLPACDEPLRSYAGICITSPEDDGLGVLHVADHRPRRFAPAETAAIEAAAVEISVLLESQRRSRHDTATGALGRDGFVDTLLRMVSATRGGHQRLSLVRLDLTALRASLDAMGAGLGRITLRRMAEIGLHQIRRRDCFGRMDDDVFTILLADTGETGARILADRLSRHLLHGWSDSVPNTGSVVVEIATAKPVAGDDAEAVLQSFVLGKAPGGMPARQAQSA